MSKKSHFSRRRRRFAAEVLEPRNLMAAKISELLFKVQSGSENNQSVIELRAEPQTTFESGTYLALVNEYGLSGTTTLDSLNRGLIHTVIDLSGLTTGSNGFLTLLQSNSPHQVDEASAVVRSTSDGFAGLPDGRFKSMDNDGDLRISFGAQAFMLVQSDRPVAIRQDVDANNDGVLDPGAIANWTILDSISVHPFVGGGDVAYSPIVFAEEGVEEVLVPNTSAIVIPTEGFGYVARVGASEGSTADDWMAAGIQELDESENQETDALYEIQASLFGRGNPYVYTGRDLDHFGAPNFLGTIKGRVTAGEDDSPRAGVVVLADTNGNGRQDELRFVVDPDEFGRELGTPANPVVIGEGTPLTNAFPGVTITNSATPGGNQHPYFTVTSEPLELQNLPTSNDIFARGATEYFTKYFPLRFDFYQPVNSVAIDAMGPDLNGFVSFGRLEAYDAQGELIESVTSRALIRGARQTISIRLSDEQISHVLVYGAEDIPNVERISFSARFDRLVYTRREAITTTDAEGRFSFHKLTPGNYRISASDGDRVLNVGGGRIEKYETLEFNLESSENVAPITSDAIMNVSEKPIVETVLGRLTATDPNGQNVRFAFTSEETYGLILRPETGEVVVGPNASFDFEMAPSVSINFSVTDPLGLQATGVLQVGIDDANDAPTLELPEILLVSESTAVGTVVGKATGQDQDSDQTVRYRIAEGADGLLSINPETGDLTLLRALNFEENKGPFPFVVEVTDNALEPLTRRKLSRLTVRDANEPPSVVSDLSIAVSDTAKPGDRVHLILATDPDNDSFRFRFEADGGSGSEYFAVSRTTGHVTVVEGADLSDLGGTSLELNVVVSDFGSPVQSSRATLVFNITDNNQAPVLSNIERLTIAENSPAGTVLGAVSATDPDGDSIRYEATAGTGRLFFAVNPETGQVTVAPGAVLNFESRSEYSLTVTAIDNGEPSLRASRSIQIRVTDVPESLEINEEKINPPSATVGRRFEYQIPSDLVSFSPGASGEVSLRLIADDSPRWLRFESAQRRLVGVPTSIAIGTANVTFEVSGLGFEPKRFSFPITVAQSENVLVNEDSAADVDNDGAQTPLDALAVMNFLRRSGGDVSVTNALRLDGFFDVSRDRTISPLDALEVINRIRRSSSPASGESVKLDTLEDAKVKRRDLAITELYGTESRLF